MTDERRRDPVKAILLILVPILLAAVFGLTLALDKTRAELAALKGRTVPLDPQSPTPLPPPAPTLDAGAGDVETPAPTPVRTATAKTPDPDDPDPSVPTLVRKIHSAIASGKLPKVWLTLLATMHTTEAKKALVELFLHDAFADPEYIHAFRNLKGFADPRLGPAAIKRYKRCVEDGATSWVTMTVLMPMIARNGGAEGLRFLKRRFVSGPGMLEAWESLHYAKDPAVLEVAEDALRNRWGPAIGDAGSAQTVRLMKRFGSKAIDRFDALVRDPTLHPEQRRTVYQALGRAVTPAAFDAYLAGNPADEAGGASFLALANAGAARSDLSATQVERLRAGVARLIDSPKHGRRALYAIEYKRRYQTPEAQALLETRIATETDAARLRALKDALGAVKRELRRRRRAQ